MSISRRSFMGLIAAGAGGAALPLSATSLPLASAATAANKNVCKFGVDVNKSGWPASMSRNAIYHQVRASFNGLAFPHMKHFSAQTGDWNSAAANFDDMLQGETTGWSSAILCARAHTEQSQNDVMTKFQAIGKQLILTFCQEVQAPILNGELRPPGDQDFPGQPYTAENYRSTVSHMIATRDAHPYAANVKILINNAGGPLFTPTKLAQCKTKGCDVKSLCSNLPGLNYVSVDYYWQSSHDQTYLQAYLNNLDLFAGWAQQAGIPASRTAVTEWGIWKGIANRPQLYQRVMAHMNSLGLAWANEWEGASATTSDWYGIANDPATLAAYLAIMAKN